MDIEDTILSDSCPYTMPNSIVACTRLIEVLSENQATCIEDVVARDERIKPLVWLLAKQVWGIETVDLQEEYSKICVRYMKNQGFATFLPE